MQRINWYPEYWTFIEKNKLFDYWRSRYAKHQLMFSPSQLSIPVDFFDASYEFLKTNSSEETEREWLIHKGIMTARLKEANNEDKCRLQLQLFAEVKAYEYWEAKVVLRPIEEDEVGILKDTLWLINERERSFKEAFAQLIEYDRKYLSPLTDPEREFAKSPINISEAYHWLVRNNIPLQVLQDIDFFQNKKGKIKPLDTAFLNFTYLPQLLVKRHEKALFREKVKGFFRSTNGEILREENKAINLFSRPETVYSNEPTEETALEMIEKFKAEGGNKYKLNEYSNTIRILDSDKYHLTFAGVLKDKGKSIPKSPYALIQKKLFDKIEQGNQEEREKIFTALKEYADKRKRGEFSPKPEVARIEQAEQEKGNIFSNRLYFSQNKKGEIEVKPTEGAFINPEKMIENAGLYFLEVEEKQDIEAFMPDYIDEFDDTTRFKFFRKDWFGLKFDRKKAIDNVLTPIRELKNSNIKDMLKSFKNILSGGLNKSFDDELSSTLLKKYTPNSGIKRN